VRARVVLAAALIVASVLAFASSASALIDYEWQHVEGKHDLYLHNTETGEKTLEQSYDGGEWDAEKHRLEGIRECLSRPGEACGKEIHEGDTGVTDENYTVDDSAQSVVEAGQAEGASMPQDVTGPLDELAENAGELDLASAGEAVAGGSSVLLGSTAFTIGVALVPGVALGVGLDQLFGYEDFSEETEAELVHVSTEHKCYLDDKKENSVFWEELTEGVHYKEITLPKGYYQNCVSSQATERKTNFQGTYECKDNKIDEGEAPVVGPRWHTKEAYEVDEESEYSGSCKEQILRIVRYEWAWIEPECNNVETLTDFFDGELPSKPGCAPVGLPKKGLLTKVQEETNEDHYKTGEPPIALLPHIQPTVPAVKPLEHGHPHRITEQEVEKTVELPAVHKYIPEKGKKTAKELKEAEEEQELEIPAPLPLETGADYKTELEDDGFMDITVNTLPESAEDPSTGPEGAAYSVPASGTWVVPETHITVEQNPDTAPVPAEAGRGIEGPSEPGIKLPSFPVLCRGFPFGVPCWLMQTIEGWSSSAVAPEWGIENLEIDGHHITGKFKLSQLEPIMEKVRPAMVIFATIGLVLLFYGFAKGGGPPSGSASDHPADNLLETGLDGGPENF
jgi:hypothetical protein